MSFSIESSIRDGELTLVVSGRLSSAAYESFVQAVRPPHQRVDSVVIDVTRVESIDSSGLGMLLITREAAGANHATIRGCSSELRRVLEIVNFGQLFELE